MLAPSTIQLLRFHFSFFLLPVYLFALSQVPAINTTHAVLIFFILHILVYPSSNGYNSYMDRDETPIGGVKAPLQPTRQLFYTSVVMDVLAIALSFFISYWFTFCIVAYIAASRAYSYRGIRLKKYPVAGYLTVIIFQGAVTFFMVYHGSSIDKTLAVPAAGMLAASLLIGGFYPLTQVYQHEADKKDGVVTISALLGYKGTFIFTAIIYTLAMSILAWWFFTNGEQKKFMVIATMMLPILVYFFKWSGLVWKDVRTANFRYTMRMNLLASICTNLAFLTLLIWRGF
ncbi:UbiA family prenyltransferase [Niastella sp. OAS944]|uniref:UbiA family prenyltransferase n=1 Tax=Niastella sp. OAS944 TaxID=2664089 RepID=UPI003473EE77|nr:1,4-dihydroxy-2-naphthoate octaprenyltransferase [Chitinophagaceae bacterium OAS944]